MPKQEKPPRYNIEDLLYLMQRLRDPERGCPWDIKQSFQSIVPYTIEEVYEVADAMERGDRSDMRDELGDLLFQVIFYAQIASEEESFEFSDVVDAITSKLVRRHPHVFPGRDLHAFHPEGTHFTDDQIKGQWDAIKAEERALKAEREDKQHSASILDDIPLSIPAMGRAEKLQRRAANVGFDWDDIEPVFDKVQEELQEVREVYQSASSSQLTDPEVHARLVDEVGDLYFSVVNLARFLKVNSDEALRHCNQKFYTRFRFIEDSLKSAGKAFEDCTLKELDELWNKAKTAGAP